VALRRQYPLASSAPVDKYTLVRAQEILKWQRENITDGRGNRVLRRESEKRDGDVPEALLLPLGRGRGRPRTRIVNVEASGNRHAQSGR
jgi:hypothetical protein